MTNTMNLVERLLARARQRQEMGCSGDALVQLNRLAGFLELPPAAAEEVQARLGELHLKRRRFRKARRHLLAALAFDPDNPRYHHLLGLALSSDPSGDLVRAWRHYRRALALAPEKARWRAEAGLLAVRLGRVDEGLALLRQAHEQAPDETIILGKLVKGLCQAALLDDAERLLRLARFRAPRCRVVARLWVELRLARLLRAQQTRAAEQRAGQEPVLLPFVGVQGEEVADAAPYDEAHTLPGPHLVRLRVRRGCRRVP